MAIKFDLPDGFGTIHSIGSKWVAFDAGDTDVNLDGTFTLQELKEIISKIESHLTPVAADECHSCGAIDMFSDDRCIECGARR